MSHVLAMTCLLLTAIVGMTSFATSNGDDSPSRITTKHDNDKVDFKVEKNKATVSIHCPFGISQAVIERRGENWPDSVTLRLHLKGLEHFKVTNGETTLKAAVSSHGGKQPVRLWLDDKENSPLNVKSPFWMVVRMVGNDGKPVKTLPLVDGHFEMQLSKALFKENPKSITISWIDFYR
jgi:hypothetical protein